MSRFQTFVSELKRRSVFKVATVYAMTAWGASLGAAELLPAFGAPDWSVRVFVLVAVLGLPIAVVLAWAYEITPAGIVRDSKETGEVEVATTRSPRENTTVLFAAQGSVRVAWIDTHGSHEKVFSRSFRIGRDDSCEVHLDDPLISRRHAEVGFEDGVWWLSDLGSRNGTILNGQQVTRAPLAPQSEIRLYETSPSIHIEVRAASSAPTVANSRIRAVKR